MHLVYSCGYKISVQLNNSSIGHSEVTYVELFDAVKWICSMIKESEIYLYRFRSDFGYDVH